MGKIYSKVCMNIYNNIYRLPNLRFHVFRSILQTGDWPKFQSMQIYFLRFDCTYNLQSNQNLFQSESSYMLPQKTSTQDLTFGFEPFVQLSYYLTLNLTLS